MNILNFEAQEIDSLEEIVEKQKAIMFSFEPNLEKRVEEFDIDIYEDQMLLKEFLLERAVEEITEAGAAIKANHVEHYKEEMIDVFNFLIETAIILGDQYPIDVSDNEAVENYFNGEEFFGDVDTLDANYTDEENQVHRVSNILKALYDLIQCIGELTNLLKQRPWRESQYPVDLITFKARWKRVWLNFWLTQKYYGFNWKEFKAIWSKKYQVNKFRIESNY